MIGKTISRYKITEKIGEGGMGSVWRAEDPHLGREVALKFLPESLASSPEARRRFLREGKAAATLRHPGIATVHDAGESDGRIFIAFELVDGETVSERISRGPLDVTDACRVAFDAAEALDHAHARGVLHRDVTSRNIMIDREDRVIVVDFGLALPHGATRVTHSGMAVGTAPYLSPEVITGKEGDVRADVYGLGVVFYEMLTGRLPFDAERSESLFYLVVHTDAEAPSAKREGIPAELDRVVMKALAKDPEERYQSAREFAKDLYSYLEAASDRPPSDRWLTAPPPAPRPQPMPQRLKRIATKPITWVATLAIVAAVVYGITKLTPEPEPAPGTAFASVAVLPFQNLGDTPEESAWLAEGIAEALTTKLTSALPIRVTPWFTSRNVRDPSRPLGEIANEFAVEALVTGTVRRFGKRVLCTVSVVDAKTQSQWWAEEYEEPLDDLFSVQRRIALGVATSLKGKLSGEEERELVQSVAHSVEAYEHYLRGSVAMRQGTPESLGNAIPFFERAIELDPTFADAYVGLGAVYDHLYYNGVDADWQTLLDSEKTFQHALELNPKSVGARRGLIRVYWAMGQSEDVLRQGREALRADPDGTENLLAMSEAYVVGGLGEKAIPMLQQVLALDPASDAGLYFLVIGHLWVGRYDLTIDTAENYLQRFGEDTEMYLFVAMAYQALGDLDVAKLYYERCLHMYDDGATGDRGFVRFLYSTLLFDMGEEADARGILSDGIRALEGVLSRYPDHYKNRCFLAAMYGLRGDLPRLRQEFDKAQGTTRADYGDRVDAAAFLADACGERGIVFVAAALARSGEINQAAELLETASLKCHNLLNALTGYAGIFPDGFFDRPEVQPAMQAMRALRDNLAARYWPARSMH